MVERTARCCCGDTWITFRGEPERVLVCHCTYCQRRTGSVFQVSAWFLEEQIVAQKADNTRVINDTPSNAGVDYTFCARCGSTVFWPLKLKAGDYDGTVAPEDSPPGLYGVAVGCFEDPSFPAPTHDWLHRTRHHWVAPLDVEESYADFPPPEKMELDPEFLAANKRTVPSKG